MLGQAVPGSGCSLQASKQALPCGVACVARDLLFGLPSTFPELLPTKMTIKHLLTVSRHAECQALLQAAGLASVPIHTVHHTVLLPGTLVVDHARTLRSPKEAFAAFARDHAIVDATRLVTAHFARNDLDLG